MIKEKYKNRICSLYEKGYSGYTIAKNIGCDPVTIFNVLKENNISRRKRTKEFDLIKKEVCFLYEERGWSLDEIARKFHWSHSPIRRLLKENKIPTRKAARREKFSSQEKEKIINNYLEGKTVTEIAERNNASRRLISRIIKEKGISLRPNNFQPQENHINWKGGISRGPYCELFNEEFKERVRFFWGRKCGVCFKTEKENGAKLSVHHVSYDKDSCCNKTKPLFIPFCRSCHTKTNHNRNYWEEYLSNYIMIWNNGRCYLEKPHNSR